LDAQLHARAHDAFVFRRAELRGFGAEALLHAAIGAAQLAALRHREAQIGDIASKLI